MKKSTFSPLDVRSRSLGVRMPLRGVGSRLLGGVTPLRGLMTLLFVLGALAFVRPAHRFAFDTYISFKGVKQGQFKGATKGISGKEDQGWFEVDSYSFGADNTASAGTAGATGKSKNAPIVITKKTDAASPLLLNAHVNNEAFESVVIETVGRPQSGAGEVVTERITLTNAQIVHYKTDKGIENLAFNYEQLTRKR